MNNEELLRAFLATDDFTVKEELMRTAILDYAVPTMQSMLKDYNFELQRFLTNIVSAGDKRLAKTVRYVFERVIEEEEFDCNICFSKQDTERAKYLNSHIGGLAQYLDVFLKNPLRTMNNK